jgi:hypothetical protein
LETAVQTNDILIDKPVRGLKELDLLLKDITVPNSMIDLMSIIGAASENANTAIKVERGRIK